MHEIDPLDIVETSCEGHFGPLGPVAAGWVVFVLSPTNIAGELAPIAPRFTGKQEITLTSAWRERASK
jgi:hypothetical protein